MGATISCLVCLLRYGFEVQGLDSKDTALLRDIVRAQVLGFRVPGLGLEDLGTETLPKHKCSCILGMYVLDSSTIPGHWRFPLQSSR